jgi:glycerol-3-phosphate dehydrogenase (NAD(P)+)
VTCLSQHSRNHRLGEKIGQGKTPKEALAEMTMVAEGMVNAPAAHALAEKMGVSCPLIQEIYAILYQGKNPKESLHTLMNRLPQEEWHE